MNCECLNALYHQPNGKKVFCHVDSSYRLTGSGLVEIQTENDIFYFGAHFENGIAAGTGFVCVSTNVEQIAGIRFENDRIVAVNDQFATERAIVDEDTGRRWEGWIDQYHIPCGFGRFYDDDGNLDHEAGAKIAELVEIGVSNQNIRRLDVSTHHAIDMFIAPMNDVFRRQIAQGFQHLLHYHADHGLV